MRGDISRKQLIVCVVKTFSGVCARHQVGVTGSVIYFKNFDWPAGVVWIGLIAGQAFERFS